MQMKHWFSALKRMTKDGGVFFLASTLSLVLVVGVNAAVFALLDQMLLSPLPYRDINALLVARPSIQIGSDIYDSAFSVDEYRNLQKRANLFSGIGSSELTSATISLDGALQKRSAIYVDEGLIDLLGLQLEAGGFDGFSENDARQVVVVSNDYWRTILEGNPAVVGSQIQVDGQALRVAGVLGETMRAPVSGSMNNPDFWLPSHLRSPSSEGFLDVILSLKRPDSSESVVQVIDSLLRESRAGQPPIMHAGVELQPLQHLLTAWSSSSLWIMQGIGLLIYLVAAGNLASVFLLRCEERARELAIHSTQGAGARNIFWLIASELLIVCAISAVIGILLAALILPWLQQNAFDALPAGEIHLDLWSAGVVLAGTLLGGLLVAAIQVTRFTRREGGLDLACGRGVSGSRALARTQSAFIALQASVSVAVLIATVLLAQHLKSQSEANPGYRQDVHYVKLESTLERGLEKHEVSVMRDVLLSSNGVDSVGVSSAVPLSGSVAKLVVEAPSAAGQSWPTNVVYSDPGYFEALSIVASQGRLFDTAMVENNLRVALVNDALAKQLAPTGNVLGLALREAGSESAPYQIIGVVPEINSIDPRSAEGATVYLPFDVAMAPRTYLLIRGSEEAIPVATRAALAGAPVVMAEGGFVEDRLQSTLRSLYMYTYSLAAGSLIAIALCVVGLIGAVASVIAKRKRQIELQILLGAKGKDLFAMTVAHILVPCSVGVALGIALAFALSKLLQARVFGFEEPSLMEFFGVGISTLAGLTLLAALPLVLMLRRDSVR